MFQAAVRNSIPGIFQNEKQLVWRLKGDKTCVTCTVPYLVKDARPGVTTQVVLFLALAAVVGTAWRGVLMPMADKGDRVAATAAAVRLLARLRFSAEEVAHGEENIAPPTPTPIQGARLPVGHPDTFPPPFSSLHGTGVGAAVAGGVAAG